MMKKEDGHPSSAIWLLGDSNPVQWQDILQVPLDSRHPIRHNIWTSVWDVIQEQVFEECRNRVSASSLYIRNAIENPACKPSENDLDWKPEVEQEMHAFGRQARKYRPPLLLCFGAFSFEFARRALELEPKRNYGYWGAKQLGQEFRKQMSKFNVKEINAIPLLHRSIAGGRFMESHNYFCEQDGANYFEFVGRCLAQELIKHRDELPIWVQKVA